MGQDSDVPWIIDEFEGSSVAHLGGDITAVPLYATHEDGVIRPRISVVQRDALKASVSVASNDPKDV